MLDRTAAIYIRVSTEEQASQGYSLAGQARSLSDYCERQGWAFVLYEESGLSAKDIVHRPKLKELVAALQRGEHSAVVVWQLSRITRSVPDLYALLSIFSDYDVRFVSVTEGFDVGTVLGRLLVGILGVIAQFERELTSERVQLAMAERARQGKSTCSYALGYRLDKSTQQLVVVPGEAEIVRAIFETYLGCRNASEVARRIAARGMRGARGGKIDLEGVRLVLTRPIYVGYYRFKGKVMPAPNIEPIISATTYNAVQRIISTLPAGRKRKCPLWIIKGGVSQELALSST
ncbi:MAG: recombinase family protein [Christensenellaceae bacterium]|jgi:site-specific DNA recombinase|nr:recombinase family protein [Christensenellaceae bacterium]